MYDGMIRVDGRKSERCKFGFASSALSCYALWNRRANCLRVVSWYRLGDDLYIVCKVSLVLGCVSGRKSCFVKTKSGEFFYTFLGTLVCPTNMLKLCSGNAQVSDVSLM